MHVGSDSIPLLGCRGRFQDGVRTGAEQRRSTALPYGSVKAIHSRHSGRAGRPVHPVRFIILQP